MLMMVAVMGIAISIGCERRAPTSRVASTAPATTTAAATEPADTQPAVALINIDGHSSVFPVARLRIERDGDHLVASVFSDDPREALRDNYTGNSFYLKMDLDISDPALLDQTQWHYQAPSSGEREDSPYGIFLAGRKTQLQPYDVRARFRREGSGAITVLVAGQFQVVETTPGPARMLPAAAELLARVDKMPAK
jgi:hypothetical protein